MLDGFVSTTVGVGDTDTTGEEAVVGVVVGVLVAVAVAVAVAVGVVFGVAVGVIVVVGLAVGVVVGVVVTVGVGVEVGGPLAGSEVAGNFASKSLNITDFGCDPCCEFGDIDDGDDGWLACAGEGVEREIIECDRESQLAVLYFPCNTCLIVFSTLVSMRVFRRTQTF